MVLSILMILLVTILLLAILDWLGPKSGIPGNILMILKLIVIVVAIFKTLGAIGLVI